MYYSGLNIFHYNKALRFGSNQSKLVLNMPSLSHFSEFLTACLIFLNMEFRQAGWYDCAGFRNVWEVIVNVVVGLWWLRLQVCRASVWMDEGSDSSFSRKYKDIGLCTVKDAVQILYMRTSS